MRRRLADQLGPVGLFPSLVDDGNATVEVTFLENAGDALVIEHLLASTGDLIDFAAHVPRVR